MSSLVAIGTAELQLGWLWLGEAVRLRQSWYWFAGCFSGGIGHAVGGVRQSNCAHPAGKRSLQLRLKLPELLIIAALGLFQFELLFNMYLRALPVHFGLAVEAPKNIAHGVRWHVDLRERHE